MISNEYELKEQICEIGRRMYSRRMVAANDGNISVRLNENEFLCTPTGVSKGYMTPEVICRIDAKGNVLDAKMGYKPSSEMKMHLRVYEKRPDVRAVVHAHPIYATVFAVAGMPLDKPIMPEVIVNFGSIPMAGYGTPSTSEIPDSIEPYLADHQAILLESHGALTWSDHLEDAYMKMESLEFYAELLYKTRLLGVDRELDGDKIKKLNEIKP